MRAVVLLADGFEEIEALTTLDVLKRAGIEAEAATINDYRGAVGAHDIELVSDKTLHELKGDIDAIIIPGGSEGVENLAGDEVVLELIRDAERSDKLIAAICAGPLVLEKAGILEGKKTLCYPGLEDKLSSDQGDGDVLVDGRLVTSKGPATSMAFALKIVELLQGEEKSRSVAEGLLYR